MDLAFSVKSVDTSLAQEYLKKKKALLELYNDYNGTLIKFSPYSYNGKEFIKKNKKNQIIDVIWKESHQKTILNLASKLKQNATLITQLEYYIRNIPVEDTSAQLNLIIQYIKCCSKSGDYGSFHVFLYPNDPLLLFGRQIFNVCRGRSLVSGSKATAAICHLLVTLLHEAGFPSDPFRNAEWVSIVTKERGEEIYKPFLEKVTPNESPIITATYADDTACLASDKDPTQASQKTQVKLNKIDLWLKKWRIQPSMTKAKNVLLEFMTSATISSDECDWFKYPVKGLDSGTVAVVSDDADVDSAVDKLIAVSMQAPWRLRRILVQESVYQQFKDALSWKCNLNKSGSKSLNSDVLCSDTLTYKDRTFLIDPVELSEEKPSVVTVEAYRTTKEMISLVQQYQARYLSLWTNGIAEINEVTHSTKSPVVWVNNVADFRGPPQIAEAVFSWYDEFSLIQKCDKVAKLCELSQSWLKLDLESRRDILYGVLDKYIVLDPANKLYTDIRNSLSACTLKSFVDVGKDYVCIGMSQPKGIVYNLTVHTFFCVESFESLLQGNALILFNNIFLQQPLSDLAKFEQAGVPVAYLDEVKGDFQIWKSRPIRTRVVWTNSGTIFAN